MCAQRNYEAYSVSLGEISFRGNKLQIGWNQWKSIFVTVFVALPEERRRRTAQPFARRQVIRPKQLMRGSYKAI